MIDRTAAAALNRAGFFFGDLDSGEGDTSWPLQNLGFTDEEMRDGSYQQRIHREDIATYLELWRRVQEGRETQFYCEYRVRDDNGQWHWVETLAVVISRKRDGTIGQVIGVDRIIEGRKQAEEILHQQYRDAWRRFEVAEALRQTATMVTADLDLSSALHEAVQQVHQVIEYDLCEVALFNQDGTAHTLTRRTAPGVPEKLPAPDTAALRSDLEQSYYPIIVDELPGYELPGHRIRSLMAVPLRIRGELNGVIMVGHRNPGGFRSEDVYPALALGESIAVAVGNYQFHHGVIKDLERDHLTGFLTRRSFERDVSRLWPEFCSLYHQNVVAMIDIDHFKQVNDRWGHPAGDAVIQRVAELVRLQLRGNDILGRYGGEEFIVVLPNTSAEMATQVMERIRGACEALDLCEIAGSITVSIGVAASDASSCDLDEAVARADGALYRAKNEGRNRVVW